MQPVVELKARDHPGARRSTAGETVGYNGALDRAARPSRIATIAVGYADGYPRSGCAAPTTSRAATAIVGGVRCPFVGRVSMDLIIVDVTDVPDGAVAARRPGRR